ncbi:MAG: 30S ribosomal protein S11 [Methanobacteriota archaeon]|nr:MAG: 30S ribosomal protein S11 [Euryarchaeota archaeon]
MTEDTVPEGPNRLRRAKADVEEGHPAHIHHHNNVLMTATDLTGAETICKVSGGMVTKGGSDSGGQFASTRAAERMAEMLAEKEFNQVIVKYRGAGGNRSHSAPGATSAIRALTRAGVSITRIEDVTPVATDGTKSKGGRRGRRV